MNRGESTHSENQNPPIELFNLILIVFFTFALLVTILSFILQIPLSHILRDCYFKFFFSYYVNGFFLGFIGPTRLSVYIFIWILLSVTLTALIKFLFKHSGHILKTPPLLKSASMIALIIFITLTYFQGIQHAQIFIFHKYPLLNKPVHEKSLALHGPAYIFSERCKQKLSGNHKGKFLTDIDITRTPGMGMHRTISYFLYPRVDIRIDTEKKADCLVIYQKKHPEEFVPENFNIIFRFGKNSLLAIEEK